MNAQAQESIAADAEGIRLHPLGLVIGLVQGLRQLILPIAALIFGAQSRDGADAIIIPMIAAMLVLTLGFRWLAWRRFRYIIGAEDIRIESGILNRTARSIPFERIQDVSIEQKLLARLLGLGAVKFETGSGKGEDATLSYVSVAEGERLRGLVRDRKEMAVGEQTADIGPADQGIAARQSESQTEPIFAMDTARIFTFGLFEFSLVIFAVFLGIAQQFDAFLPIDIYDIGGWMGIVENSGIDLDSISLSLRIMGAIAALGSLILIGIVTGLLRTFMREYGFRLDRTAKGFRRRRGLTTLTDVVMPVHRVQAAIVQTGFFRQRWGWHALKFVSLAQDSKEEDSHIVAPFARRAEIDPIIREAGLAPEDASLVFRRLDWRWWFDQWSFVLPPVFAGIAALMIFAAAGAKALLLLAIPAIIAVLTYLNWKNSMQAKDSSQLYYREGWWSPRLTIMPQVKIQSVEIAQGPLARLRGLAEVRFGVAGGSLSIGGLPLSEAEQIRLEALDRIVAVDFSDVNRA